MRLVKVRSKKHVFIFLKIIKTQAELEYLLEHCVLLVPPTSATYVLVKNRKNKAEKYKDTGQS